MSSLFIKSLGSFVKNGSALAAIAMTLVCLSGTAQAEGDKDRDSENTDVRTDRDTEVKTEANTDAVGTTTTKTEVEVKVDEGKQGSVSIMDQSNEDVDLTRRVRQEIVKDDSLSMSAKNIKIVSDGGVVTLQGNVASASEEDKILMKVKQLNGVVRVDNRLQMK